MVVCVTFKEFLDIHLAKAGVSECEGVFAPTNLPMSKLTSFNLIVELNSLSWFPHRAGTLLCEACFIASLDLWMFGSTKPTSEITAVAQTHPCRYWGGPPLGVQNLYAFPAPKMGIKQIEQFNGIILRILRSRLESQSWNSFNSFPIVNDVSAGRCTDSARLRQDSATKDIKTGTKLW